MLLQARPRSGSYFFNDKKTYNTALMAAVNSNYQFTMEVLGDAGRQRDGGVSEASNVGQALEMGLLNMLPPRGLYNDTKLFSFVLVEDEAFLLKKYLIKEHARRFIK